MTVAQIELLSIFIAVIGFLIPIIVIILKLQIKTHGHQQSIKTTLEYHEKRFLDHAKELAMHGKDIDIMKKQLDKLKRDLRELKQDE